MDSQPTTGAPFADWTPRPAPNLPPTTGRYARLVPFDASVHGARLFDAVGGEKNAQLWRFIPIGPHRSADELTRHLALCAETQEWRTHVIFDSREENLLGMASYMRIRPEAGSAEVGCIVYSPALQKTPVATDAMYLMARHVFDDLGYRRYEWKCNNANLASKRAAVRLGFTFEGVFRQDMVMKGENRDTAWYSMLDREWPRARAAFEAWLKPANFDGAGRQRRRLEDFRAV